MTDISLLSPEQEPVTDGEFALSEHASSRYGAPRNSRYVAALLSLGVCALLLLALLSMAAIRDQGRGTVSVLTALNLTPPPPPEEQKKPVPKTAAKAPKPAQHTPPAAAFKPPPHVEINNPNKVEWPEGFVHTSHAEMAKSDISNIHSGIGPGNAQASGGGGHSGGDGPDDEGFYRAEWYRKPPRTALDSYMKPGQDPGRWAEVACRMIENYHVEDCHELGEEPRGSGMARVLREAAWQFLVRPPRRNGKPLIGERVRIHYDFTHDRVEELPPMTGEAP